MDNKIDIRANEYWGFNPIEFKRADYEGWVYVLYARRNRLFKIGMTRSDPQKRLNTIQTSIPDQLAFVFLIQAKYPERLEFEMHLQFEDKRLNGEWFNLSRAELELIHFQRIDNGYNKDDDILPFFYNDGMEYNKEHPTWNVYSSIFDGLKMSDADIMEMHHKYGTSKWADVQARWKANNEH